MVRSQFCNLSLVTAIASALLTAPIQTGAQIIDPETSLHLNDSQVLPPTRISASFVRNYVEVVWNNVSDDMVNEYHVFRYDNSNPDGTLKEIGIVLRTSRAAANIHFQDHNIDAAKAYTYFITCKTRFGNQSVNSKTAQIATPPRILK